MKQPSLKDGEMLSDGDQDTFEDASNVRHTQFRNVEMLHKVIKIFQNTIILINILCNVCIHPCKR